MAGLGLFDPKSEIAVRRDHTNRQSLQILHWTQKNGLLNRYNRKKLSFGVFD
jgi:hypothetical protein